jgi:hypothetical protein
MKNLLITILLLSSFLTSLAQAENDDVVPTEREFKEWCLSGYHYSKRLEKTIVRKDSIITVLEGVVVRKNKRIASYERDSINHLNNKEAFKEELTAKDRIILQKDRSIRKHKTEKALGVTIAVLITVASFAF